MIYLGIPFSIMSVGMARQFVLFVRTMVASEKVLVSSSMISLIVAIVFLSYMGLAWVFLPESLFLSLEDDISIAHFLKKVNRFEEKIFEKLGTFVRWSPPNILC